jgi:hypothetical protein
LRIVGQDGSPSSMDNSHVIRYDRLRRGNFFADFRRDKRLYPEVYHCIVQRENQAEILAWTQHFSLESAQIAAEEHLQRLCASDSSEIANKQRAAN